jgi:hypothetical protein
MRRDQIEDGRLTEHSRGMGTVTREMVLKRAREIALINGRSEGHVIQSDFDRAKRELTGGAEMVNDPEAPRDRSHAELRETVRGTRGRAAPTVAAHDEQTDTEKLVEGGVMDAEHDRMVEGAREGLRRDNDNNE